MIGLILLFLTAYALIALIVSSAIVFAIVRPRRRTYAFAVAHGLPLEPSELGLSGQEVTFNLPGPSSGGHTTPGWVLEGSNADGPVVLILHGHRDFIHGASRFVATLAPHASYLVLFDWPGHGGCTAPWMTCGKREANDVIAVLDGLPDTIRDKPIALFGYSLGGQIAVKAAGLYPDRFAGVIIDGAYRRWDTPIHLKLQRYRVPSFPFVQLVGLFFYATNLIRNFDRVQYAKRYPGPMLVLHGTEDRICPLQEGKELADAAPNSTFVPIEGGQHNKLHEQEPEAYAQALENLFSAVSEPL